MRIGIDFDNTIVGYGHVFAPVASSLGLLPEGFAGTKQEVREALRRQPDGENAWMRLQGQVYGAWMSEARLIEGVADFLIACRRHGAQLFIVSHKTETGHFDAAQVNLRDAARQWMAANQFFDSFGFGFAQTDIYFHATRAEKVAQITRLKCDVFIDDLAEVFLEPGFPPSTRACLYFPSDRNVPAGPFTVFRTWTQIADDILPSG